MMNSEMVEDISDKCTPAFGNLNVNTSFDSDVQLSLKSFFYTWTVGNFSKCLMFSNPKFYSPEFVFENTVWRLRFHATEESSGEKKISIRLVRKEKGNIDFYIKNKVSLIDDEGKVLSENEFESCFQGDSTTSGQVSLILDDSKPLALSNDKLIVHSEFLVLASNVCNEKANSFKNPDACDSKFPSAFVPPPKGITRPKMPPSSKHSSRRLNEKSIKTNSKEGLMFIFLMFLSFHYVFKINEITMKYEEMHNESLDAEHLLKRKALNELIIDSTLKLKGIAEALNLTDVKLKATEVLTSYLKLYKKTNSTLPFIRGNQINASELFTSGKDNDIKLPMFGEGKKEQEAVDDKHH